MVKLTKTNGLSSSSSILPFEIVTTKSSLYYVDLILTTLWRFWQPERYLFSYQKPIIPTRYHTGHTPWDVTARNHQLGWGRGTLVSLFKQTVMSPWISFLKLAWVSLLVFIRGLKAWQYTTTMTAKAETKDFLWVCSDGVWCVKILQKYCNQLRWQFLSSKAIHGWFAESNLHLILC